MTVRSVTVPDSIGVAPCDLADVTVVIPAFNEEASLPSVLHDLPEVGRVIVVNNGSTDGTAVPGFTYTGTLAFDYVITWLEFAPWFILLAFSWASRHSGRMETWPTR